MTYNTFPAALTTTVLCSVLAVSACVPIPYANRTYAPDGADVTLRKGTGSGCGLGTDANTSGYREIGPVRVSANVISRNSEGTSVQAKLQFSFIQQASQKKALSVSVNPARVKLEEGGRTLRAKLEEKEGFYFPDGTRGDYVSLLFAAPSGESDTLRVVFEPGAIRVNGRSVAFAPIRYKLDRSTSVYMFPCIPT